jgi:hypothetical protein
MLRDWLSECPGDLPPIGAGKYSPIGGYRPGVFVVTWLHWCLEIFNKYQEE